MDKLHSRSFSGATDLDTMIALVQTLRTVGQVVYPIATDLYEELSDPSVQESTLLWEDNKMNLVGFAYVNQYQYLVDAFDLREFTKAIEKQMFEWVERATSKRNRDKGETNSIDASTLASDAARVDMLERNGFTRQPEYSILLAYSFDKPLPVPQLPGGFSIRPMRGESEIHAYVALHRSAFKTENMTVEYRRAIMSAPSYIPELDLVAVAPDGSLAAFCVCQIFPDDLPRARGNKEGWTDPLGVHPAFQRLGLAKALILTGMRLLKERGIDTALLGTSSTNSAMQHTAESIGFKHISHTLWYSKTLG